MYTPVDRMIWEFYIDWLHTTYGIHPGVKISDDGEWKYWRRDLAIIPARHHNATWGKVVCRFVRLI